MMQAMRHPKTLKYGLWAVLIIIIPSFVAFYGFSGSGSGGGGDAFAGMTFVTVDAPSGRRELRRDDLFQAQQDLADQYAAIYSAAMGQRANGAVLMSNLKRKEIAEHAVALVGLDELAKEEGIFVSRDMVAKFLADNNMTKESWEAYVASRDMTEQQAIEDLRRTMRIDRARASVSRLARASLLEMWTEHKLAKDRFRLEYVKIPFSAYRNEMQATEEEIAAYFEKNKDRYVKREERIYRYAALSAPPVSPVEVTEADLVAEYAAIDWDSPDAAKYKNQPGLEVRQIMIRTTDDKTTETVRGTLEGLRDRIRAGEDFAKIADEYTEDMDNISFTGGETIERKGGVVGTRVNQDTLEELAAAYGERWTEVVFGLQPSQESDIFESNGALYLVRGEKLYEERMTLEEANAVLRTTIRERRMGEERTKQLAFVDEAEARLRKAAAENTTLEAIAKAVDAEIVTTSPTLAVRTTIPELGNLASNREALEALEVGIPSPVMRTDAGGNAVPKVVVIEVAEIVPERPNTLDEVRVGVESAVKGDKAKEKAKEVAEAIRAAVEGGKPMAEAAQDNGQQVKDTPEPFDLSTPPGDFQFVSTQLRTELFRSKAGDVKVLESPLDAIVFRVVDRQEPDMGEFLAGMGDMEREFNAAKGQGFIQEFQRESVKELKAKYDENYVAEDDPRVARRRAARRAQGS